MFLLIHFFIQLFLFLSFPSTSYMIWSWASLFAGSFWHSAISFSFPPTSYCIWSWASLFAGSFWHSAISFSFPSKLHIVYEVEQVYLLVRFFIQLFLFPFLQNFILYMKLSKSICWLVFSFSYFVFPCFIVIDNIKLKKKKVHLFIHFFFYYLSI
jgi:hypothetical protein